jgi:two-component system KDP operon response regulator KdpE
MSAPQAVVADRVLVIDAEPTVRRVLKQDLAARGYRVDTASAGRSGLDLSGHHPDLVVLDVDLPDIDGIDVIARLRAWSNIPILVLSARQAGSCKVAALDAGADDYVTKPFGMDELAARVRAVLRRSAWPRHWQPEPEGEEGLIVTADFTIDLLAKTLIRAGVGVRLTPIQWHLVEVLVNDRGHLVTKRRLLAEGWGPGFAQQTPYLRVFLAQIRHKLEPDPAHPRYVVTEAGMGYRFEG